jgi:hypothetical protein
VVIISKLEVIFCAFLAENNFVNALILFIRVRIKNMPTIACIGGGTKGKQGGVYSGGYVFQIKTLPVLLS